MNELIQQVQAASTDQPDWLRKKRQLAAMLLARFSTSTDEQDWITAWQNQPQLNWLNEDHENDAVDGLYDQPLNIADQKFPALCQENWMEKGLFWQDSQINALHLALLNGGRLIYVPDDTQVQDSLVLEGSLKASNYHTLVIVGAGASLRIADHRQFVSDQPVMAGVEILLGTGAQVEYHWSSDFQTSASYMAVGFYQAQQSELQLSLNGHNAASSLLALHGDLDGDDSSVDVKMGSFDHDSEIHSAIDTHAVDDARRDQKLAAGQQCHWQGQYGQSLTK